MPTYDNDILPSTAGLNLGNDFQRWNLWADDLFVDGSFSVIPVEGVSIKPGGAFYVLTNPQTANANNTDYQTLVSTTVPAGLLNSIGKVLRFTASGTLTTQSGQAPQVAFQISLGGVAIFGLTSGAISPSSSGYTWRITGEDVVFTAGSSGFLDRSGILNYRPSGFIIDWQNGTVGPVDLTANQTLEVSCRFTTNTSPANICQLRHLILEILN